MYIIYYIKCCLVVKPIIAVFEAIDDCWTVDIRSRRSETLLNFGSMVTNCFLILASDLVRVVGCSITARPSVESRKSFDS